MKFQRKIALLLTAIFGGLGVSEAAVIRRQTDEAAPFTLKMEQRPVAEGFIDNASNDGVELMKKKKKKKKKKKSKAS